MSEVSRGANKFKLALLRAEELRSAGFDSAVPRPVPGDLCPASAVGPPSIPEPAPVPEPMPVREMTPVLGPAAETGAAVRSAVVLLAQLCRNGVVSDHVRVLRTRVIEGLQSVGGTSVLVTSPGRREGKTFTARHLAASIARELSYPTVLVEAAPATAADGDTCDTPDSGLAQCLSGAVPVPRVLMDSDVPNLRWVPAGRTQGGDGFEPSAAQVESVVRRLREHCAGALLIFDGPCLLGRGDALLFGRCVDRSLLVVRSGTTKSRDVRRAVELLGQQRLLGIVCNGYPG